MDERMRSHVKEIFALCIIKRSGLCIHIAMQYILICGPFQNEK